MSKFNKRLKWKSSVIKEEYDGKVIIADCETSQWVRISKEIYSVLEILKDGCDVKKEDFEDPEDYNLVLHVYEMFKKNGILCVRDKEVEKKLVSLQITNNCNLRCRHCCVSAGEQMMHEMSTKDLKETLKKIIEWNPKSVMLSGGEPLYRPDFFDVLQYLRKSYSGKIILSTNALLIDNTNVRQVIDNIDSIDISIDGVDEETCSLVRGKGVFDKVLKRVELLQKNDFYNISLSMTFSDKNIELEKRFVELNKKLGTEPVCRLFSAIGRGEKNRHLFSDVDENREIFIPEDYLSVNYKEPFGVCMCSAGTKELFIKANGDVVPCPTYMDSEYLIGNILKYESISRMLKETEFNIKKLESNHWPFNIKKCKKCPVKWFCWTCPGEILSIKNEKVFESRCGLLKPVLMERVWESDICM